jgi:amidase
MAHQAYDAGLCDLAVGELVRRLASGEVSAVEVLEAHLQRIDERNGALNAVVSLDADGARQRARAADVIRASGQPLGALHGVPLTLKDGNDVAGLRTTIGTEELDNVPVADGVVAMRLRAAGANIVGHTNVAAWLADHQSANPVFGCTSNPWDMARTAGGSSGGAAAAVATGMTPADVGSDMVGSLRQPASFCGVYALKTTEHRVPLTGFFRTPDGPPRPVRIMVSLGPLARNLDDVEMLLSLISGPDGLDSDVPAVPLKRRTDVAPAELRLAVAPAIPGAPIANVLSDQVNQVASAVANAGGRVEQELPDISWDAQAALYGELLQMITTVFSPDGGSKPTLAQYLTALDKRDKLIAEWERFFERYDALLMPAAATVAYPHSDGQSPLTIDGVDVPYREQGLMFALSNLNGLPGLAMPSGLDPEGLPAGVQLIGARWTESDLLAIARGFESAGITPGFQAPPIASWPGS